MSPTKWIVAVNAIGIVSKSGRYGGTFAHSDIAFEFASWISAEFKLYIIKDCKRLKTDESSRLSLGWNLNREISNQFPQLVEIYKAYVKAGEELVKNGRIHRITDKKANQSLKKISPIVKILTKSRSFRGKILMKAKKSSLGL